MPFDPSTAKPVGGFDPSTAKPVSAQETPSEPSFGEKLGGLAYGTATGLISAPGETEHFLAHTVPEYLGYSTPEERGTVFGRETIFPTQKEVESVLSWVGVKEPKEEVSGYKTTGEIIGGIGPGLPGLARSLGRTVLGYTPAIREAAAKSAEKLGFKLSPAQVRAEGTLSSKGAIGYEQSNQELANKLASESTGKISPEKDFGIGDKFISERFADLGQKFDKIYVGKNFNIDQTAIDAIRQIRDVESALPSNVRVGAVKSTADNIVNAYDSLMASGGRPGTFQIEGEALQRIRNDMTALARRSSSQDAHYIYELVDKIDGSIARLYPNVAKELNILRPQYRNTIVLEDLMRNEGIQGGDISLEKLGDVLAKRPETFRKMQPQGLDKLGEIGRNINMRARWEPVGSASRDKSHLIDELLGKIPEIPGVNLLTRSRAARAVQRATNPLLQTPGSLAPAALTVPTTISTQLGKDE